MKTIISRELKNTIFNFKTLLILLFLGLISYTIGKNYDTLGSISGGSAVGTVYGSIETVGVFFGFLLFSGTVAKMVENESIRYVLPYISKTKILLSKYLSMLVYFIFLLSIILPIIVLTTNNVFFPWKELLQAIIFFGYISSLILMLSVIARKEKKATFIGIFFGILIPILGAYSMISKNVILKVISWLLPYRYEALNMESLVLIGLTVVILGISITLFKNMEV